MRVENANTALSVGSEQLSARTVSLHRLMHRAIDDHHNSYSRLIETNQRRKTHILPLLQLTGLLTDPG